ICTGIRATPICINHIEDTNPVSLMLFSSAQPSMSTAPSVRSIDGGIDAGELIINGNLPELLALDLETSGAVFMSRDMTSGCPGAGLAAPGSDASPSFDRPRVPYRASYRYCPQQEFPVNLLHLQSLVMDEATSCFAQHDDGRQPGVQRGSPDSSSAMSIGMDPLSIRTRQQSVTTAATSLSGRCSSLSSHNPLSPSSFQHSPYSCNRHHSSPGTWYEAEPESPREGLRSSVSTARTSISDSYAPALHLGDNDDMDASPKSITDWVEVPTITALYPPGGRFGNTSQPRTPASQLHLEKPRIVNIPPASIGRKHTLSAKESRYGAESNSITSEPQETEAVPPAIERHRHGSHSGNLQRGLGMPLLATANGRTVIDASGPPSAGLARPQVEPHERETLEDSGAPATMAYGEVFTDTRKPPLAKFRRWVDASAETPVSPQSSRPHMPNAPSPGIPLPPEMIESLRVSIACFPETMLLTSSLSIETIRAYSKKLRHRADLGRHFGSTDKESIYSSGSHNDRPTKRWNTRWRGNTRRSSNPSHHHQPPPGSCSQQQQHYSTPNRSYQLTPADHSNLTLAPGTPLAPAWAPIKNIFPSASDYLCDALYAHLLVRNYITSLIPPTRPVSPPTPARPGSGTGTGHQQLHQKSPDTYDERNLRIPQKAASLLGMDDPVSATAAYHQQQHQRSRGGRSLLSRRAGSSQAIQGLFSPSSLPGTRKGVGSMKDQEASASLAAMTEIQAGLGRCIALLVATLNKETGEGCRSDWDEEEDHDDLVLVGGEGEKWNGGGANERVEPVLMRALCEVVRCAEEGSSG
ncbi:hypothetical protein C8A03DRAFT_14425, partial [Achaetomium macrosporum]